MKIISKILIILLFIILQSCKREIRENKNDFYPFWFATGPSCEMGEMDTKNFPFCTDENGKLIMCNEKLRLHEGLASICPEGSPRNIFYVGNISSKKDLDTACNNTRKTGNDYVNAIDSYLVSGASDTTYHDAAVCIALKSRKHGIYHCAEEKDNCFCILFLEFSSEKFMKDTVKDCIQKNPGGHP